MSHFINLIGKLLKNGNNLTKMLLMLFFKNFRFGFTGITIIYTFLIGLNDAIKYGNYLTLINDFVLRLANIDNYFYNFDYILQIPTNLSLWSKLVLYFKYYFDIFINFWWLYMLIYILYYLIKYTPFQSLFRIIGIKVDESQNWLIWPLVILMVLVAQTFGGLILWFENPPQLEGDTAMERLSDFGKQINPIKGLFTLFSNIENIINPLNQIYQEI